MLLLYLSPFLFDGAKENCSEVYMMFFALGTYLPMVIMSGYVDDMSTSNGVSAEYLTELHSFMNSTMVAIIAIVTFVAGIIGALIAKGVFKKHFQKAGIV